MLEVKKARAAAAGSEPTTAQYLDRMEREAAPVTLRIDDRPPLVIKDARAYQLLWERVDRIETLEAVREGLEQVEQGRTLPLEEIDRRLRKKHGIRGWGYRGRSRGDRQCLRMHQGTGAGRRPALVCWIDDCLEQLAGEPEKMCSRPRGRVRGTRDPAARLRPAPGSISDPVHDSGDTVEIVRVLHGARAAARR